MLTRLSLLQKFFADRGTHLAAMIAYYALVSFVPLVFLALALLGVAGQTDASSFFVHELGRAFPSTSVDTLLRVVAGIEKNAAAIGILGGAFLLWSALGLFSALESAVNIVYGRPNRAFFHGKGIAALLMIASLVALFASLVIGAIGVDLLRRRAPSLADNPALAYALSIAVSLVGVFVFVLAVYRVLTNAHVTLAEALPGAVFATVVLEASFQVLPLFVRYASVNLTLRAFGGPAILLIWLYVMANVIVLGAELNWWLARRREALEVEGLA